MVNTERTPAELGDLFTMAGFELEELQIIGEEGVLDINVMANRGDGASVLGLARELLAKDPQATSTPHYDRMNSGFQLSDSEARTIWEHTTISIETDSCNRFAARLFLTVPTQPSPEWLTRRLELFGQRPINLLVDLTNYVMLELGQPLHAYDFDKLTGHRIIVRQAKAGETLKTLDGATHQLFPHHLVIADGSKAVGLAGVMGGEETEVSDSTIRVLLESAHFEPTAVRRTRKDLGFHTEASYRFERSVDPEGVVRALDRYLPNFCTRLRAFRLSQVLRIIIQIRRIQRRSFLERPAAKRC